MRKIKMCCCAKSNLALFFLSVFLGTIVTLTTIRTVHLMTSEDSAGTVPVQPVQQYNNRLPRTEEATTRGGEGEETPQVQSVLEKDRCSCENNSGAQQTLDTTSKQEVITIEPSSRPQQDHALSIDTPTIFIITPTYKRLTQKVDLVRLCQTLMLVQNITWIVVEDSDSFSNLVTKLLKNCKVRSVHLHAKTTTFVSRKKGGGGHRGVEQRNAGLKWIRENHGLANPRKGVVYFGDDDNGYDIRLFEEMRYTKVISIWPVGFVGMLRYEGPKCENDKVIGFHTSFRPDRKFPVDMAAFAINLDVIMSHPSLYINHKSQPGMLECDFLVSLGLTREQLEPKANNCLEIYVWHIKTEKPKMPYARKNPGNKLIEV